MQEKVIKEPARNISILGRFDILVAGGGPAGIGAAIAAARKGMKTILIERYGHLGGMATGGLVLLVGPYSDEKTAVIGGIAQELVIRAIEEGVAVWEENYHGYATFDPEGIKNLANQMIIESGAKILLHSWVVDVYMEGKQVKGVIIESKQGRQAVVAKRIIDATGDGDLCHRAGCEHEIGCHPWGISLCARLGNVKMDEFNRFIENNPEKWEEFKTQLQIKGQAESWLQAIHEGVFWFDGSFCNDLNALKPEDLTHAEIFSRESIHGAIDFYRKNLPGFEECFLIDTASQIGVRETRRIIGEHVLTEEDVKTSKKFEDRVFMGSTEVSPRIKYTMPYQCLVPKKVEGILMAGRCISCTHKALDLVRTISPCLAMGQAAGTAAAQSIKQEKMPGMIDIKMLQSSLRDDGMILE